MKKIVFAILALAAIISCSKSEVIEVQEGEAISFGNTFVDNATKADYSKTDITAFNVYGTVNNVNIYNATQVTKGDAAYGAAWTCGVTQYWVEGAAYKFAALVDVPDENVTKDTYGMPVSFTYTADGATDVLYNYVERIGAAKGSNSIVAFNFKHLLAKAYFTVNNGTNDSKYTYSISDVKVTSTYPSGTYTVYTTTEGTGSWGSYGTAGNTTFADITDVAYGTPETNAEVLLIPGAKVGVSFKVTLKISGTEVTSYTHSVADVVTLAQNSVYNFNITLSPNDPIQFTVTEQPKWNGTTDTPITIE